eukprot:7391334-Prymnesium_polylepis.3
MSIAREARLRGEACERGVKHQIVVYNLWQHRLVYQQFAWWGSADERRIIDKDGRGHDRRRGHAKFAQLVCRHWRMKVSADDGNGRVATLRAGRRMRT